MRSRSGTLTVVSTVLAALTALIILAGGTALAGTTGRGDRASGTRLLASGVTYAIHRQILSADGTSMWGASCPAGAFPVGGGTTVQDPLVENVTEAGFHTSPATGKFDGYQATVRVSGLAKGAKVLFAVQVACVPADVYLIYAIRTQLLPANGTSFWGVPCPPGSFPVGGGTIMQNPLVESVTQAGFHPSATGGAFDGYQASVRVSGLPSGRAVLFAVQVVCVPAATPLIYGIRTRSLSAKGGATSQQPVTESVPQSGFHVSPASGRFDGYQASVRLSGPPNGRKVRFAVEVACIRATSPPVYGPGARSPRAGGTLWAIACPSGTIPLGGGTTVQDPRAPVKSVLLSLHNSRQVGGRG